MNIDLDKLGRPIDISIPLRFNGPQPNAYGVEPARSEPVEAGDLIGDTRRGGSVNFEQYTFIPHCNGTHTECVGHITDERISIRECLRDVLISTMLVSITPVGAGEIDETCSTQYGSDDLVITRQSLELALSAGKVDLQKAIMIRTLPNDLGKLTRQYGDNSVPPYFTSEAMEFIVECGFSHLLVDMPSIDRIFDEGKLLNHRIFWNVEEGSRETNSNTRINSTITEMIYVPDEVTDGEYLLNLQIAPFDSDCAPSRPVLFNHIET